MTNIKVMENEIIVHEIYNIKIGFKTVLKEESLEQLSLALEDKVNSVFFHNTECTDGDDWEMSLTTLGEPNIDEIISSIEIVEPNMLDKNSIIVEKVPETNWLQQVHDNFPPITIGKFFIYGSHYDGELPEGLTAIKIDAATAFGSGEHETTRGCIKAFEELSKQDFDFKNILDMGCGSGILSIAINKIWSDAKLTAIDIDPESVVVTKRHAEFNNVENIMAECADGYNSDLVKNNSPFDLIASNILANPLIAMAPDLAKNLKSGGYCVLAGLLTRQYDDVIAAHVSEGLELIKTIEEDEWRILIMKKS